MRWALLAALAAVAVVASCAAPGRSSSAGGRYVDPYTCEIKNKKPEEPAYDADCIRAAQATAEAASRAASRKK